MHAIYERAGLEDLLRCGCGRSRLWGGVDDGGRLTLADTAEEDGGADAAEGNHPKHDKAVIPAVEIVSASAAVAA